MNHFGLKDLNDLPKIKEFEMPGDEIGIKDTDDLPLPEEQNTDGAVTHEVVSDQVADLDNNAQDLQPIEVDGTVEIPVNQEAAGTDQTIEDQVISDEEE